MKKRVEICSVDSRTFVRELLALGKQGATLPDDAGVFKGMMLRAQVEIDDDVLVKENQNVRVLPQEKGRIKDAVAKDAVDRKTAKKTATKKEETESNPSEEQDKE